MVVQVVKADEEVCDVEVEVDAAAAELLEAAAALLEAMEAAELLGDGRWKVY